MKRLVTILILGILLSGSAFAQLSDHQRRSRMSVLSKAGTPVPRAKVPNRTVSLPRGARRGYNYYYGGYGRSGRVYGVGTGYQNSGYRPSTIPGLVTRPNTSASSKRRRHRRARRRRR